MAAPTNPRDELWDLIRDKIGEFSEGTTGAVPLAEPDELAHAVMSLFTDVRDSFMGYNNYGLPDVDENTVRQITLKTKPLPWSRS
jgi:hypothetical protein